MSRLFIFLLVALLLISCTSQSPSPLVGGKPSGTAQASSAESLATKPDARIPVFEHIVIILFENRDFKSVIGNANMPFFNTLAEEYALMTDFSAVTHPSLPNYIALIGGDTFGIDRDCIDCFVDAPNLADLIEASGRSWKAYQEDMPQPCFLGDAYPYAQKHNPFMYFDSVRLDQERCERSVVPLTQLNADIQSGTLPDFIFITPNLCHDSHDCDLDVADTWLSNLFTPLKPALDANAQPYLIVVTFDEGLRRTSFLDSLKKTGGQIPVVLVSPTVKNAFQDDAHYNHYSLLKTIAESWGLEYLGHAKDEKNLLITTPWK